MHLFQPLEKPGSALTYIPTAYLLRTYDHPKRFQGAGLPGHNTFIRDEVITSFASASFQPFLLLKDFIAFGAVSDRTGGRLVGPRIKQALAYLEAELGEQDYFMGSNPGRADFMLSWPIDMVVQRGWAELGPKLKGWRERVLARDGWKDRKSVV